MSKSAAAWPQAARRRKMWTALLNRCETESGSCNGLPSLLLTACGLLHASRKLRYQRLDFNRRRATFYYANNLIIGKAALSRWDTRLDLDQQAVARYAFSRLAYSHAHES